MDFVSVLGIIAGICTTSSIIPQIRKAWTTKEVDDLSPIWLGILILGVALWTVYGIIKGDIPIIIFNGLGTVLDVALLALYFKYKE
jgi:MtN3 and saliva related transmembrane protein